MLHDGMMAWAEERSRNVRGFGGAVLAGALNRPAQHLLCWRPASGTITGARPKTSGAFDDDGPVAVGSGGAHAPAVRAAMSAEAPLWGVKLGWWWRRRWSDVCRQVRHDVCAHSAVKKTLCVVGLV